MTQLSIESKITGSPDAEDKRTMEYMLGLENDRRLANVDEDGNPVLPQLPTSTNVEMKNSYEELFTRLMVGAHASYIREALEAVGTETDFKDLRPLWKDATPQQQSAAIAALGGTP